MSGNGRDRDLFGNAHDGAGQNWPIINQSRLLGFSVKCSDASQHLTIRPPELEIGDNHTRMPYPFMRPGGNSTIPSPQCSTEQELSEYWVSVRTALDHVQPSGDPLAIRTFVSYVCDTRPGTMFADTTPLPSLQCPPVYQVTHEWAQSRATEILTTITSDVTICEMSPAEVQSYNLISGRRLRRLQILHDVQKDLLPWRDEFVDHAVFFAGIDYRLRMLKTFRMDELPLELMQRIFQFVCCPGDGPDVNVESRLRISSVCRLWRNALIGDTTIWNTVWFRGPHTFEQARTWLDRSGQTPLVIYLDDTRVPSPDALKHEEWLDRLRSAESPFSIYTDDMRPKGGTIEMAKIVADILSFKLPTIRALTIRLRNVPSIVHILQALSSAAKYSLPIAMKRFELHKFGRARTPSPAFLNSPELFHSPQDGVPVSYPLFGNTVIPALQEVIMTGAYTDWSEFGQKNLRTLELCRIPMGHFPSLRQFRAILSASPTLTRLVLSGGGARWPSDSQLLSKPVLMPVLTTLIFDNFPTPYGAHLMSQLDCPAVTELTLVNLWCKDHILCQLMTGKMPNVRSLRLCRAGVTNDDPATLGRIVRWFNSMPMIQFISVEAVTQKFLNLLCWDGLKLVNTMTEDEDADCKNPVCPLLTTLEVHMIPPTVVKDLGIGRARQGVPLTRLYVGSKLEPEARELLTQAVNGPVMIVCDSCQPREIWQRKF